MPTGDATLPEANVIALGALLVGLFSLGLFSWTIVWGRIERKEEWIRSYDRPRANWQSTPELFAVSIVLVWIGLNRIGQFIADEPVDPQKINLNSLLLAIAVSLGIGFILMMLLNASDLREWSRFGFQRAAWTESIRDGAFGFSLSIIPMAMAMTLVSPLRTPESQNPLLRILTGDIDWLLLSLVVFIAVIVAPLTEELMFRVILQGAACRIMPRRTAILVVALAFCAVHGPLDSVALLPLALILGSIFERTHNYLTVVMIHGLFNATMLSMQMLMVRSQ